MMCRKGLRVLAAAGFLLCGAFPVQADLLPFRPNRPDPVPRPPPACAKVPVLSVESARLEVRDDTIILSAAGTAGSAGWRDAELRFVSILHPESAEATAVFALVACPPEISAQVLTPLAATTPLRGEVSGVHRFRIEARSNAQTVTLDARPQRP